MIEKKIGNYLKNFEKEKTFPYIKADGKTSSLKTYSVFLDAVKEFCKEKKIPVNYLIREIIKEKPDYLSITEAFNLVAVKLYLGKQDVEVQNAEVQNAEVENV